MYLLLIGILSQHSGPVLRAGGRHNMYVNIVRDLVCQGLGFEEA